MIKHVWMFYFSRDHKKDYHVSHQYQVQKSLKIAQRTEKELKPSMKAKNVSIDMVKKRYRNFKIAGRIQ